MNVVITGASTGIGEACARWLDRRGHRVFAGVRRQVDADRLRVGSSNRLTPVVIDVTNPVLISNARAEVERAVGVAGVHGLVNNAGIAVAAPLEHLSIDDLRRQLEVNVIGHVDVTQSFLPLLRKARGRIVFMSSIGGRMVTPFLGPYCASKFALEALADSLRIELLPWGMHVAVIEPGSVATPIWSKADADATARQQRMDAGAIENYGAALSALRKAAAEAGRRGISPDAVAAKVEHALAAARPKTRYIVGGDARVQAMLGRLLPDRVRDRFLVRMLKLPSRI